MNRILAAARSSTVRSVKSLLDTLGLSVIKSEHYSQLTDASKSEFDVRFIRSFPIERAHQIIDLLPESKAQLRQDLFVLLALNFKSNGYFIEFGATDGITLSNTYLLEKKFGWTGILAEPALVWRKMLCENRQVIISTKCVWSKSGTIVQFCETPWSELSTAFDFLESDRHEGLRKNYKSYAVPTISLEDLIIKHHAPSIIDFLSIDTEGSEFDILNSFPFGEYKFRVIACEHNFTENREKIFDLLSRNGYVRVLTAISDFDDWYVHEDLGVQHIPQQVSQ